MQQEEVTSMTYFIKDCQQSVSAPAESVDEIAAAVAKVFEPRPYIVGALYAEPYGDGSGADIPELLVVADRRFGVPHRPWAVTGCEEFIDDLLAALGRDVDCCMDRCERARELKRWQKLRPVYKRADEAIETADRYLNSAMNSAMTSASGQSMPRDQADNICFYAARAVGQCLLASISAFGGKDIPTSALPEILAEAERVGVIGHNGELAGIAERLEAGLAKRKANEEVDWKEGLRATVDANRAADILHEVRRPAEWIPIHDGRFLKTLRMTGMAPAAPAFKKDERVEFWKADKDHRGLDARRTGTVVNFEDYAFRLHRTHGSWWVYDIDCDGGIFWKELPEKELRKLDE